MEHYRCIWNHRENEKLETSIVGHCLKRTWVIITVGTSGTWELKPD